MDIQDLITPLKQHFDASVTNGREGITIHVSKEALLDSILTKIVDTTTTTTEKKKIPNRWDSSMVEYGLKLRAEGVSTKRIIASIEDRFNKVVPESTVRGWWSPKKSKQKRVREEYEEEESHKKQKVTTDEEEEDAAFEKEREFALKMNKESWSLSHIQKAIERKFKTKISDALLSDWLGVEEVDESSDNDDGETIGSEDSASENDE